MVGILSILKSKFLILKKLSLRKKLILIWLALLITFWLITLYPLIPDKIVQMRMLSKAGNYRETIRLYLSLSPEEKSDDNGKVWAYAWKALADSVLNGKISSRKDLRLVIDTIDKIIMPQFRGTELYFVKETERIQKLEQLRDSCEKRLKNLPDH